METTITTPRLYLRSLQKGDGNVLADAVNESWTDLSLWMRWAVDRSSMTDPVKSEEYAITCHESFKSKRAFPFGGFLKENNELALVTRIHCKEPNIGYISFGGYWLRNKYKGLGLMTEAVNAMVRFSFDVLGAKRLEITAASTNIKSISVMKRLGFIKEAQLKLAHKLPNNTAVDEVIYVRFDKKELPPLDSFSITN